jgi:hypothetical protein
MGVLRAIEVPRVRKLGNLIPAHGRNSELTEDDDQSLIEVYL